MQQRSQRVDKKTKLSFSSSGKQNNAETPSLQRLCSKVPIPSLFFDSRTSKPLRPLRTLVVISCILYFCCCVICASAMYYYLTETIETKESVVTFKQLDGYNCISLQKAFVKFEVKEGHYNCSHEAFRSGFIPSETTQQTNDPTMIISSSSPLRKCANVSRFTTESIPMYFEGYTQCQLNDVSKWTIEVEQLSSSSSSSSSSPAAAAAAAAASSSTSSPSSNQTRNDSNLITFDGYQARLSYQSPHAEYYNQNPIKSYGYGYKSCLNPKNGAPATDAMESNCKPVAIILKYTADENFLKIRIPSSRSLLFQYNTISTPQSSSPSSSSEPWCHCQGLLSVDDVAKYEYSREEIYEWKLYNSSSSASSSILSSLSSSSALLIDELGVQPPPPPSPPAAAVPAVPALPAAAAAAAALKASTAGQLQAYSSNSYVNIAAASNGPTGLQVYNWQVANAADEIPELREKVLRVVATKNPNALQAYTALRDDGTVFTWEDLTALNIDISTVASNLAEINVTHVVANERAFAALGSNGKVIAWGHSSYGGNITKTVQGFLEDGVNVSDIYAISAGFAAWDRESGKLISWGGSPFSNKSMVALNNVTQVQSSYYEFIVVNKSRDVHMWTFLPQFKQSLNAYLLSLDTVARDLKRLQIQEIVPLNDFTRGAAAIIKNRDLNYDFNNSDIYIWGDFFEEQSKAKYVLLVNTVASMLLNTTKMVASSNAFSALQSNGKLVIWGDSISTARNDEVALTSGVQDVVAAQNGFVAVKNKSDSNGDYVFTIGETPDLAYYHTIQPFLRASGKPIATYGYYDYFTVVTEDGSVFIFGIGFGTYYLATSSYNFSSVQTIVGVQQKNAVGLYYLLQNGDLLRYTVDGEINFFDINAHSVHEVISVYTGVLFLRDPQTMAPTQTPSNSPSSSPSMSPSTRVPSTANPSVSPKTISPSLSPFTSAPSNSFWPANVSTQIGYFCQPASPSLPLGITFKERGVYKISNQVFNRYGNGTSSCNFKCACILLESRQVLQSLKKEILRSLVVQFNDLSNEDLCSPWNDLPPFSCTKISKTLLNSPFASISLTLGNVSLFYYLYIGIFVACWQLSSALRKNLEEEDTKGCSCCRIIGLCLQRCIFVCCICLGEEVQKKRNDETQEDKNKNDRVGIEIASIRKGDSFLSNKNNVASSNAVFSQSNDSLLQSPLHPHSRQYLRNTNRDSSVEWQNKSVNDDRKFEKNDKEIKRSVKEPLRKQESYRNNDAQNSNTKLSQNNHFIDRNRSHTFAC